MNAKFTFVGLEDLKAELRNLPANLTAEANEIVRDTAESAGDSVRARYSQHVVTGNLMRGVRVKKVAAGKHGVSYRVASTGFLSSIFEKGTEARHYITVNGKKKLVGKMPAFNIFGPIMARKRRAMWDELWTLLTKHGMKVSGTP